MDLKGLSESSSLSSKVNITYCQSGCLVEVEIALTLVTVVNVWKSATRLSTYCVGLNRRQNLFNSTEKSSKLTDINAQTSFCRVKAKHPGELTTNFFRHGGHSIKDIRFSVCVENSLHFLQCRHVKVSLSQLLRSCWWLFNYNAIVVLILKIHRNIVCVKCGLVSLQGPVVRCRVSGLMDCRNKYITVVSYPQMVPEDKWRCCRIEAQIYQGRGNYSLCEVYWLPVYI